jgi:hypothetical protein
MHSNLCRIPELDIDSSYGTEIKPWNGESIYNETDRTHRHSFERRARYTEFSGTAYKAIDGTFPTQTNLVLYVKLYGSLLMSIPEVCNSRPCRIDLLRSFQK